MDIVAHGLWAGAAGGAANRKLESKLRLLHAVIWGVFPDAFAFLPVLVVALWHRPARDPVGPRLIFNRTAHDALPGFLRPEQLYQVSHSLLVFLAVFLLARLMLRRPCLAMLAWSLHILMDIPTHASGLYRTPFLWPVSEYRFSGIWWSRAWFMILNYSLIAVACVVLFVWRPGAGKRETAGQTRAGEPEIRS